MNRVASQAPNHEQLATFNVAERPALAPDVQLVGELKESGFTDPQWLIQRDGTFVQVTELLYRICQQANGERTLEEIATGVTESTEWMITADQVQHLIETKLRPLGLVSTADSPVEIPRGDVGSPLRVNLRTTVVGPRVIDPITRVLQILYAPPLLVPILAIVAIAHGWVYLSQGHAVVGGLQELFYTPILALAMLPILIVGGIFHEFGHAAALRYGGGRARGMGVGFYLIYPVIYTDTSDSYRLGRWARVRTDLGGFYFTLIFALGLISLYAITGQQFLLLIVLLISLDILYQSLPFVRFDGYWAFADLTGIPDLFSYMKPFLKSMVRGSEGERIPQLKPWVRRVFLAYISLTLPVLGLFLFLFVTRAPGMLATAFDSYIQLGGALSHAISNGNIVLILLSVANMTMLALMMLGIVYMFYNLGRKAIGGIWSLARERLRIAYPLR